MRRRPSPNDPYRMQPARSLQNLRLLSTIFLVPGIMIFLSNGLLKGELRVWEIYLVNLLFWSGFSQAGVVLSSLIFVTNGKWVKNIRRAIEGSVVFSPISFVLFLVLFLGKDRIFPWIEEPIPEKAIWLNITFLFVREAFNLLVINVLNVVFMYYSLRPDVGLLVEKQGVRASKLFKVMASGWRGYEVEKEHSENILRRLSPLMLIVYAIVYSIIAFDFIMSLEPFWYSTLFGAYYFMTNLYIGLAGVALITIIVCHVYGLELFITKSHFHDLGKLIFAFCLISLDFFWSQYLVIWYGNMPEEISFLVTRINDAKWFPYTAAVLINCFILPFIFLLSKGLKLRRKLLFSVALLVFASMWLERYILVVPSLWQGEHAPFGYQELSVTVSFLAGFLLVYTEFVKRFPVVPLDADRLELHSSDRAT